MARGPLAENEMFVR